jgi:glycine/D-amino acid oxidase-like deaminating enzyme
VTRAHDVLVVGAGIVGAACALALREEGLTVALIDAGSPGAGVTAAGMGHLVALDESDDELDLCLLSLRLWRDFHALNPGIGDPLACGTLWVAENEHQLAEAHQRAERLGARGYSADAVGGDQLRTLEPALRRGLCGGVRVAGDSVVYPPSVADFLTRRLVGLGGDVYLGQRVHAIASGGGGVSATLASGAVLHAGRIVVAAGVQAAALLPELPVFGRKGHLAITDRYPDTLRHQVVSMDYGQPAPGADALSVAANVQPRATGQWLVGSCRQDHQSSDAVDPAVLAQVLRSAMALLPRLARMNIVRTWTGMRPATPDGKPLIGPHPGRDGVWLACGHEGLGVTTSFGTAALLAAQMMGRYGLIDAAPWQPSRFASLGEIAHAA